VKAGACYCDDLYCVGPKTRGWINIIYFFFIFINKCQLQHYHN
jgi:hypothetical protein